MINYPVGDFLIRIKNAALAGRKEVSVKRSKRLVAVAKALEDTGYLQKIEEKDGELRVKLTYQKKEPVLMGLKVVSKPGVRIYMTVDQISQRKGPEILIVSTNKGIFSSKEAIKKRVGGEIIAKIL